MQFLIKNLCICFRFSYLVLDEENFSEKLAQNYVLQNKFYKLFYLSFDCPKTNS